MDGDGAASSSSIVPLRERASVSDFESSADLKRALEDEYRPTEESPLRRCHAKRPRTNTEYEVNVTGAALEREVERLQILKSYWILDRDRDESFERITALASRIFNAPIVLVSLVDLRRQWFMSNRGLKVRELPRSMAFCGHAIFSEEDLLIVPDTYEDDRFRHNPLVTGDPFIRFYAGAPLVSRREGHKLGTLCVIDTRPRPGGLDLGAKQNLRELAAMVSDALERGRSAAERSARGRDADFACVAHSLLTPLSSVQLNLSLLMEDEPLWRRLDDHQRELLRSSYDCSEMMSRVCHREMDAFRGHARDDDDAGDDALRPPKAESSSSTPDDAPSSSSSSSSSSPSNVVRVGALVRNLTTILEPYPKSVPLTVHVHENVPDAFRGDDVGIFRALLSLLTNACDRTRAGSVALRLYAVDRRPPPDRRVLTFECEDTGPDVRVDCYPRLFRGQESGLRSVAVHVDAMGGEYGFHPRASSEPGGLRPHPRPHPLPPPPLPPPNDDDDDEDMLVVNDSSSSLASSSQEGSSSVTGSIFWFTIPLLVYDHKMENTNNNNNNTTVDTTKEALDLRELSKDMPSTSTSTSTTTTTTTNSAYRSEYVIRGNTAKTDRPPPPAAPSAPPPPPRPSCAPSDESMPPPPNMTVSFPPTDDQNDENVDETPRDAPRRRRAIVVDDSLTIRKSLARALDRLGFDVCQAVNGMAGLEKLKATVYDVCFCDFLMPVMDGLDCVAQYRDWEKRYRPDPKQHIIGISAHASQRDVEKGLEVGMNEFLPKPLRLAALRDVVSSDAVSRASRALDDRRNKDDDDDEDVRPRRAPPRKRRAGSTSTDDRTATTFAGSSHDGRDRPTCLLAERSRPDREALAERLESRGLSVCPVAQGEDALRMLKTRNWDVVLVDDRVPVLSAVSCVTRFREWEASHRVVRQNHVYLLHSCEGPRRCRASTTEHSLPPTGFDGTLTKPVNLKRLHRLLDDALSKKSIDDQLLIR